MMTGLLHLHSLLRWVILVLLVWAWINSLRNKNGKEVKFLTITSHIMLLIGLIQYFFGKNGMVNLQEMSGKAARFYGIEHPLTMIIAIVLITIAGVSVRKGKTNAKWFYLIALILIISRIPWPWAAEGIHRGLFPGM